MANTNKPFGFRPHKHGGGGLARPEEFTIASGYGSTIGNGDPVKSTGTGKNIELAVAGNTIKGIFIGCSYTDSTGRPVWSEYWPAGTVTADAKCLVWSDPLILFEAQVDEDLVETDIGQLADHVAGTVVPMIGRSKAMIDSSDINNSAGTFKIKALSPLVGNIYGNYAVAIVQVNLHEDRGVMTPT